MENKNNYNHNKKFSKPKNNYKQNNSENSSSKNEKENKNNTANHNKNSNNNNTTQDNKSNPKRFNKHRRNNKKKKFHKKKYSSENKFTKPKQNIVYEICPVCEKKITEPFYAIKERESGKNAHFECILKKVANDEKLESGERIYYLGGGNFGVVREKRYRGRKKIVINKKIPYSTKK